MKASRSRYSRRLQLIQAYTRDEPDLNFRCKRSNSTSRLEIKQLNSLYSGRARPTSYKSIIGTSNSIKQNTFYKSNLHSTFNISHYWDLHHSSSNIHAPR
ncbi:hypothetical protein GIB67_018032 [Kingdonia uniflora]|uniref:Uncharacterized protein n=1 Tax=Kingdonia uniflora TaxID=39325 RepID=A0A7J7NX75_9MAGN|nr:hypothetical protein GIB67_018032 [Kingdonia uniflora]